LQSLSGCSMRPENEQGRNAGRREQQPFSDAQVRWIKTGRGGCNGLKSCRLVIA
jgi:hypothetical protein